MSKTKGNVIDPLEVSKKYGTDAFRYAVLSAPLQGQDVRMSEKTIESCMKFVTKIFNASRFVINSGACYNENFDYNNTKLACNTWIIEKLKNTIESVETAFDKHRFFDASSSIYKFFWNDFCDWYIELLKPVLSENNENEEQKEEAKQTAGFVLKHFMVLLNPIMPFISQYVHSALIGKEKPIVEETALDKNVLKPSLKHVKQVDIFVELISKVRSLRASLNVPNSALIDVYVNNLSKDALESITLNKNIICSLAKIKELNIESVCNQENTVKDVISDASLSIPLLGVIDIDAEKARIAKNMDKVAKEKTSLEKRLNNPNFAARAKAEVVEQSKLELKELENKFNDLKALFNSFS